MKALEQLRHHYFMARMGIEDAAPCVQWAVDRLMANEEGEDCNVALLAGTKSEQERLALASSILREHFAPEAIDDQIEAGKYVVELRHLYDSGKVTIEELEKRLWRLSGELGYPNWLVMLCRNCEYATDIPAFIKPFEEEFAYIAALWENATSSADFLRKYDRTISDTHDVTR